MAYSLTKASTSVLYLILLLCLTSTVLATNVFVWGVNNYGQLGLGTYNALVPNTTVVPAYQSLSVASIVAGPNYHIATMTDGTEYACGINFYGQLTLKTSVPSVNVPTPANSLNLIQNPPNLTLSIYATSGSAVGLTSAGTLYGWGSFAAFLKGVKGFNDVQWANPAQLTAYTGQVASAAVVYEATFFTLKNGNMYVSGINDNGRLGIGKTGQNFTNITPFTFFTNLGINVVMPSTSSDSVFAINPSNGNVYAWGANGQGQLGLGDLADRNVPVLVSSLIDNWHILQILPGGNHTLALTCNGHILAWGSNVYGQVGQYDTITPYYSTPQVVIGAIDKNIVEIVTGLNVNYIRSSDNRWYVWGANANGALGFGGNATDLYQPTENLNLEALDINHIVIASSGLSAYGWLAKDVSSSLNCPISLVDECASGALKCGTNALCIDSDKSAFCLCPHSFYPNPSPNTLCSPIDYCTLNVSYCDPAAACSYDSVLGTTCSCNNGFGNGLNTKFGGTGCTPYPTNCTAGFCTANAFCYVSNGRAYCNCSSGYTGDGYSNQVYRPSYQPLEDACSDIDECAESPSPCPANSVCNNTMGSFTCSCNPGTTPALDGSVCVQNICASNYSVCASGSNCTADDAGQTCSCPSGYYGDGRSTAYGGSGCTVIPVNNSTVPPASSTTSTTGLSGSNTTNTGSTVSSSTTSTTGGTTPQPSDSSETTQDIYDQGQYTGRAPADPEYNAVAFNAAANTPSAIVSSGGAASSVGHTSREKGALAAAIVVFALLFALAVALAVYVRRTRHNHLRTPIRYTNNPDNVVI